MDFIKAPIISSGRNSYAAITKSSITKYVHGTIKSVSKKTLAKMFSYTLYSSCFDVLWSGVDDACDFYGHFDKSLA